MRGEFTAKSSGWDEDRVFLEGDKLEVALKNRLGADPRAGGATAAVGPVRRYFDTE